MIRAVVFWKDIAQAGRWASTFLTNDVTHLPEHTVGVFNDMNTSNLKTNLKHRQRTTAETVSSTSPIYVISILRLYFFFIQSVQV
jgi:hypothetical protein